VEEPGEAQEGAGRKLHEQGKNEQRDFGGMTLWNHIGE